MSLQNRVNPWGFIIRTNERGTFMGNHRNIHNDKKEILKDFQTKRWITCRLKYKDRKRKVMTPHLYTELFFFDEASAFAAGHRPCAKCRRERFNEFKELWIKTNLKSVNEKIRIEKVDGIIHSERIKEGKKVTYKAKLKELPTGTFFSFNDEAYLISLGKIFLWSFAGYKPETSKIFPGEVDVLTPKSFVKIFEEGFTPVIYKSAWL